jgi:hypothetical protein
MKTKTIVEKVTQRYKGNSDKLLSVHLSKGKAGRLNIKGPPKYSLLKITARLGDFQSRITIEINPYHLTAIKELYDISPALLWEDFKPMIEAGLEKLHPFSSEEKVETFVRKLSKVLAAALAEKIYRGGLPSDIQGIIDQRAGKGFQSNIFLVAAILAIALGGRHSFFTHRKENWLGADENEEYYFKEETFNRRYIIDGKTLLTNNPELLSLALGYLSSIKTLSDSSDENKVIDFILKIIK